MKRFSFAVRVHNPDRSALEDPELRLSLSSNPLCEIVGD
jgi:hypothetical protein